MNLVNILTRRDPLKRAFVTLEDGMSDVLNEEFMLPPEPFDGEGQAEAADVYGDLDPAASETETAAPAAPMVEQDERFTAHTQNRLAGYAAFDSARLRANEELSRIGESLAAILSANHVGREFLNDCYADIHRANELELANSAAQAENRRLGERLDKMERLRGRYDQLVEVLKRREAKLLAEAETARDELAALRIETVEARSTIARHESVAGELHASLAAKTAEAERFMRDAEHLRERIVGLTVDLDLSQKKQTEARRRVEELTAVHASDSTRLAEVGQRLTNEENEAARLQKLNDALEARLLEANETIGQLNAQAGERDKRHASEVQAVRAEVQSLGARFQHASGEHREAISEISALRSRISDLESEKHILEKKYAVLGTELENERRLGAALHGDPAAHDKPRRQIEELKTEVAELQTTVSQLRQYERLYAAAKARARATADVATSFSVSQGKIVPEFQPPPKPIARSA